MKILACRSICGLVILILVLGCDVKLHKDFGYDSPAIDLGWAVLSGKLRGTPASINDQITVTENPYDLLFWLTIDQSYGNDGVGDVWLEVSLFETETKKVIYRSGRQGAQIKNNSDGTYRANFIFRKIQLPFVDYTARAVVSTSGWRLQSETYKVEIYLKKKYLERKISFWDSLMGI